MRFTHDPGEVPRKGLPVIRAKPGTPLTLLLACRAYRGVKTHYWNTRTIVCTDSTNCAACMGGQSARWQGYIPVLSTDQERRGLLQFTPTIVETISARSHEELGLLGLRICLTRLGPRRNSPLHCQITGRSVMEHSFSVEDLEMILLRLFQENSRMESFRSLN